MQGEAHQHIFPPIFGPVLFTFKLILRALNCNAQVMITGVIEASAICRWYRFHWPWFSS